MGKRLTPEYTKLAEMIQNDPMMSYFVQVVKADCDKHRSIGETFSVTGFPTLKILSRGIGIDESDSAFDYSGPRDAESMFNKLKSFVEQDKLVGGTRTWISLLRTSWQVRTRKLSW